jgi:hypothetical protein
MLPFLCLAVCMAVAPNSSPTSSLSSDKNKINSEFSACYI